MAAREDKVIAILQNLTACSSSAECVRQLQELLYIGPIEFMHARSEIDPLVVQAVKEAAALMKTQPKLAARCCGPLLVLSRLPCYRSFLSLLNVVGAEIAVRSQNPSLALRFAAPVAITEDIKAPMIDITGTQQDGTVNRSELRVSPTRLISFFLYASRAALSLDRFYEALHYSCMGLSIPSGGITDIGVDLFRLSKFASICLFQENTPAPPFVPAKLGQVLESHMRASSHIIHAFDNSLRMEENDTERDARSDIGPGSEQERDESAMAVEGQVQERESTGAETTLSRAPSEGHQERMEEESKTSEDLATFEGFAQVCSSLAQRLWTENIGGIEKRLLRARMVRDLREKGRIYTRASTEIADCYGPNFETTALKLTCDGIFFPVAIEDDKKMLNFTPTSTRQREAETVVRFASRLVENVNEGANALCVELQSDREIVKKQLAQEADMGISRVLPEAH